MAIGGRPTTKRVPRSLFTNERHTRNQLSVSIKVAQAIKHTGTTADSHLMANNTVDLAGFRKMAIAGVVILSAASCGSGTQLTASDETLETSAEEVDTQSEQSQQGSSSDEDGSDERLEEDDIGLSDEDDTGLSPEELLASDLALREDLTLMGTAPASVVAGEAFEVLFEVSAQNQASGVEVELAVPEGVSLVGDDCSAGEGVVVCIVGDPDDPANGSFVFSIEPAVLSAELVVDPGAALAAGGVLSIDAVVTEFLSQQVLSEATDVNPDDNVINLQIDVSPVAGN